MAIQPGCALVTGGSRGIGRAICRALATSGMNIVFTYVQDETSALEALTDLKATGVQAKVLRADIARSEDRRVLIEETLRDFGRIHTLVNNAGMAPRARKDILETQEDSFDEVLSVNLKGPFFLTRDIAVKMVAWKRQDPEFDPAVLFIGSISSYTSSVNRPEYCISKAGISMTCMLFADRLATEGVRVYEVRPGLILTDMTAPVKQKYDRLMEQGLIPQGRWGLPEDVARAVSMLARGDLSYSAGQVIDVDGGFHLRRL